MDEKPATNNTYDLIAEQYAEAVKTKPHNAYLERPTIRALVPDITGGRVLDAGCGPGTNIGWLIERGADAVVGVDASTKMIEIAGRAATENVTLAVADLNQPLDFLATSSFDLVFSSLVIHYLKDLDQVFGEFARLLRPGGWLVFSIHHPQADHRQHPGNYFETVFTTKQLSGLTDEPVMISFYRRPLTAITEALANAGFVIERLVETQPTDDFRLADPEGYQKTSQRPTFLCVRARSLTENEL